MRTKIYPHNYYYFLYVKSISLWEYSFLTLIFGCQIIILLFKIISVNLYYH